MDVPLALNEIRIRKGLKGYKKEVLNVQSQDCRRRAFCGFNSSKDRRRKLVSLLLVMRTNSQR